jgi:hypothetical protein
VPRGGEALFLQGMELTLGRNLFVWTDHSGYDPEVNFFRMWCAWHLDRGRPRFDFASYPSRGRPITARIASGGDATMLERPMLALPA